MKSNTTGTRVLSKPFKGLLTYPPSPPVQKKNWISHYSTFQQIPSEPLCVHRKVNLQSGSVRGGELLGGQSHKMKVFWCLQSVVRLRSNTSIHRHAHGLIWCEWLPSCSSTTLEGCWVITALLSLILSFWEFLFMEPELWEYQYTGPKCSDQCFWKSLNYELYIFLSYIFAHFQAIIVSFIQTAVLFESTCCN